MYRKNRRRLICCVKIRKKKLYSKNRLIAGYLIFILKENRKGHYEIILNFYKNFIYFNSLLKYICVQMSRS